MSGLNLLRASDKRFQGTSAANSIHVYGPLISVGISLFGGNLFGDDDPPPPPEGAVHFSWDTSGNIQHTVDYNQSGGGEVANQVAVTLSDGSTVREPALPETIGAQLIDLMQHNGGIAPAWQVQTQQLHLQQALQEGQTQEQAGAPLRLGAGGQAYAGDEAFSLQGNAAESGDFKSQTFGALVVHLGDNPEVQAAQTQLTQVLRDVEGDGYFEQTQAVAANDELFRSVA